MSEPTFSVLAFPQQAPRKRLFCSLDWAVPYSAGRAFAAWTYVLSKDTETMERNRVSRSLNSVFSLLCAALRLGAELA